jgi:hypothetical protein
VSELVAEELPHVVESCRRVYEQNVLSNMAIPEVNNLWSCRPN